MNRVFNFQIDSARMGGINEVLAVYLMAAKLGVPVCPHAGGVGLCEMVQHLQVWQPQLAPCHSPLRAFLVSHLRLICVIDLCDCSMLSIFSFQLCGSK